ncbi:DUF485 domain-containing protein [Streptomyces sp. NPDC001388]|uniref:DUF485 domain-containing protein n=1 Tax=unclassified Streptomyces TaxID=2593676 RepID=UPI00367DBD07
MSHDPSRPHPHPPRPPHTRPPGSPYPPPSGPTYPWQPQAAPPAPARPRPDHHTPLGHHSDLRILRGAYRRQRRVATLTALGYFVVFLILSAFAPSLMTATVTTGLPTGLLLALIQLPVTGVAIAVYEQTARRRVDPLADRIRRLSEIDAKRGGAR